MEPNQSDVTKTTFRSVLPVLLTELVFSGLMLGVYALVQKLSREVWLGAALGTAAAELNFIVMILLLLKAERASSPQKGQLYVRGTYTVRMVALLVILVLALKSGRFDPLATVIPLLLMQATIYVSQLFRRKNKEVRS